LGLIVLVFVLGVALGAVGHSAFERRVFGGARTQTQSQNSGRAPNPPRAVARLTKELDLTSEQQKQLSEILSDMQNRFDSVRKEMNPQFDQIREQGHDQIRQILTPEQRPKFEDFLQRAAEDRRDRDRRSRNNNNNRQ
jgi:Spy/CpxP family protein refolding chaperone